MESPYAVHFVLFGILNYTREHSVSCLNVTLTLMDISNFFINRICDVWEALPESVTEASSTNVLKPSLDLIYLN